MDIRQIRGLVGRNDITGNNIFHELAEVGSLTLLYRIRDNIDESFHSILQETNNDGESSIHIAVKKHRGEHAIKLVEVLVSMGADLNGTMGTSGCTVLHITVWRKDYTLAKWLCQQSRINLHAKGWYGLTAYHMAVIENDEQMMDIFKAYGATCAELKVIESKSSNKNK
uniref:Vankyrin 2 n=1 Tax=Campoletis chlorideae ichnovirus TaxID=219164 RepID=Q0MUT6_9VIRU|nr:vankyrin 2 [Campoletis chlorideae ichnovirus]